MIKFNCFTKYFFCSASIIDTNYPKNQYKFIGYRKENPASFRRAGGILFVQFGNVNMFPQQKLLVNILPVSCRNDCPVVFAKQIKHTFVEFCFAAVKDSFQKSEGNTSLGENFFQKYQGDGTRSLMCQPETDTAVKAGFVREHEVCSGHRNQVLAEKAIICIADFASFGRLSKSLIVVVIKV